ncbi:MAG: DUF2807 domain-containing protein [Flavobacterium sp. BFFFF1]|uniref:head GIN domain-containing protein n=1 Tax=Flavobacterium sp. BFFFF1 TaxID=2015557 RepID=UPI000BD81EA7|nr:head GIN domain-containing protein [Flavobacterium sp. BFFFF1]OYU80329.1 MAG: DUF2807 domain-containing protein [Flavobacterium sp. BFFFF1]
MARTIIFVTKIVISTLFLLMFSSCRYNINVGDEEEGSGNIVSETRNINESFSGVRVGQAIEVTIEQGNNVQVKLEADDNILPLLTTSVENGVLVISSNGNYSTSVNPRVTITMPQIESLTADSSASIRSEGKIVTDDLKISAESSASITVNVEADQLTIDCGSAAEVEVNGKSLEFEANASSSGSINATDLMANNINADVDSSGDIHVYPILKLEANASSGGSIGYHKIPKTLSKSEDSGGSVSEE